MDVENTYKNAEKFVLNELEKLNYPKEHPFNDYPKTPESMILRFIIVIKALTNKDEMTISFLKKCKSIENGRFSYVKYNQSASEVIWFYYMYVGLAKTNSQKMLLDIYDEEIAIYDNDKKFEYSFLMRDDDGNDFVVAAEVKAITCDPFTKETGLRAIDGQKLIKPFFPALKESEVLKQESDAIVLQSSTYYYQTEQNIKKIIHKCRGNNLINKPVFNIGVLFINFSTSFEEFYSYLFHKTYGVYDKLLKSNVDAMVIVSLDSRNDLDLDNIYSMGYVQTLLVNPSDRNKKICEKLRIDTYIALGDEISEYAYENAQVEYGRYKILCREGFLNIIPFESTEEEINEYLNYLKGTDVRH